MISKLIFMQHWKIRETVRLTTLKIISTVWKNLEELPEFLKHHETS
ncbi:hypothetical protein [Sphingobacterium siyangense]